MARGTCISGHAMQTVAREDDIGHEPGGFGELGEDLGELRDPSACSHSLLHASLVPAERVNSTLGLRSFTRLKCSGVIALQCALGEGVGELDGALDAERSTLT